MTSTLYTQALNLDGGGFNGYTVVMRYTASALTMPGGIIGLMRVTFEAGAGEALTITNAYIGHKAGSGDAYDFAATPVQLLFSGAASKAVGIGASAVSDWAMFTYDQTSDLLIAFYLNGGASVDTMRRATGLSNINSYYRAATNEAGTVNKTTGYTSTAGEALSVNKIESDIASNGFFF